MTNIATPRLSSDLLKNLAGLSLSAGDLIYAVSPNAFAKVPKGLAGKVLAMNGAGEIPEWADGAVVTSGAFTPGLTFGDAAVGMTFSTRSGNYRKIGSLVIAQGRVNLSAKGSSTGVARLTGFPFSAPPETFPFSLYAAALTGITGSVKASITGGVNAVLYQGSSSGDATMSDANFTATSDLRFTAVYFTS